jgi:hypothetical protein
MKAWRVGTGFVAVGIAVAVLATPVQAGAGAQSAKRLQVEWTLLSATGTVTTSIQGTYDHQYIFLEDPNTGDRNRATTASMNSTVTWTAPKQRLAGMVFGAGDCDAARIGCSIPIHKVTGSAKGTASATYADGTAKSCAIAMTSLTSGSTSLFSDFADNTLSVKMLGAGGKKVKIWLGGAYPNYGLEGEGCPGTAGLRFTEMRDAAQTIPASTMTAARIGKPFTVTIRTVAPITGKTGDTVNPVGTVTETTTLKVKVTARF